MSMRALVITGAIIGGLASACTHSHYARDPVTVTQPMPEQEEPAFELAPLALLDASESIVLEMGDGGVVVHPSCPGVLAQNGEFRVVGDRVLFTYDPGTSSISREGGPRFVLQNDRMIREDHSEIRIGEDNRVSIAADPAIVLTVRGLERPALRRTALLLVAIPMFCDT